MCQAESKGVSQQCAVNKTRALSKNKLQVPKKPGSKPHAREADAPTYQVCFLGDFPILQTWKCDENSMFPHVPLSRLMQSLPLGILFRNLLIFSLYILSSVIVVSRCISIGKADAAVCRATA